MARRFTWGPAVKQMPALRPAPNTVSADDGDRPPHMTVQPGSRPSSAPEAALDARRCALAVAQFPEGRTLAADEADPAAVLLPLGQRLLLSTTPSPDEPCRPVWAPAAIDNISCQAMCSSHRWVDVPDFGTDRLLVGTCWLTPRVHVADVRQGAQQGSEQRSEAAEVEEQTAVRFPYHAAGYDPAWLVPYAVQVRASGTAASRQSAELRGMPRSVLSAGRNAEPAYHT